SERLCAYVRTAKLQTCRPLGTANAARRQTRLSQAYAPNSFLSLQLTPARCTQTPASLVPEGRNSATRIKWSALEVGHEDYPGHGTGGRSRSPPAPNYRYDAEAFGASRRNADDRPRARHPRGIRCL